MNRRSLMALGALGAPAIFVGRASAQGGLPDKSIRIYVGFERDGGADITARVLANQIQRRSGRHVNVENRPGFSGGVPGELMKKATGDGSQISLLSSTSLVAKLAMKDFPFDPSKDVAPVSLVGNFSIAFAVSRTIGVSTFAEYLKWVKAGDAKRRRIAVSSNVTFLKVLNTVLVPSIGEPLDGVNYRGPVPVIADLEQGRIPASVNTMTSLLPAHRGGRLRILMHTGARRLAVGRDIPTATELGFPKLDMQEWFGVFAPPSMSPALVAEWNRVVGLAVKDAAFGDVVGPIGLEPATSSPAELAALLVSHQKDWEIRMKNAGMNPVI
jgi:tripartite-type tricarboxylate transporter receptor subunit TctC